MKGILFLSSKSSIEPVTLSQCSGMIPIANSPVSLSNLNMLLSSGIKSISICFDGDLEHIKNYFGDGSKYNCFITYIKYTDIESLFKSEIFRYFIGDETAVLIDGCSYYNIELKQYANEFIKYNVDTSVLTENTDAPWQSIVAKVRNGILSEIEKEPRISSSNTGVTGIYFFNQYTLRNLLKSKIPHQYNSASDIIKFLLSRGFKVSEMKLNGTHIQINSFNNILFCNRYVLDEMKLKNIHGTDCLILNSTIEEGTSVGNRCIIKDSKIKNSIIMDNCLIQGVEIYDSIICKNSTITGSGKLKGIFAEKTRLQIS